MTAAPHSKARAWRNVAVLALAQAVLGAQISMLYISGGRVGQMLAPDPRLATLSLSMVMLGSALAARPLAGVMMRHGRRLGFTLACCLSALGAGLAFIGIRTGSFWLFIAGCGLVGVYMAAQGFYRFAATDTAPEAFQPKAISLVMAGGLISGILGPVLAKETVDTLPLPFEATYLVIMGLNLLGPLLFATLDIPVLPQTTQDRAARRPLGQVLANPRIIVAMICGVVSYAVMNLVMTATPLAIVGCGFGDGDVSGVVGAHIMGMFLPSFFTGNLIARFGSERIIAAGLALLAVATGIAITGVDLHQFYGTLILVGLGWNFGYIGSTAMLTRATKAEDRATVQGVNDTVMMGCVFAGSLLAGVLINSGPNTQSGWNAVNLSMLPLLTLAGGALIWLRLRPAPPGRP